MHLSASRSQRLQKHTKTGQVLEKVGRSTPFFCGGGGAVGGLIWGREEVGQNDARGLGGGRVSERENL